MWSVGAGAAAEDFGGKEVKWFPVNVTTAFDDGQRRFGWRGRYTWLAVEQ